MPLYQACQERVTHLQICLETPVKLVVPVALSRLFSSKLHLSFDHQTSEQPAPSLFLAPAPSVRLAFSPRNPGLTILDISRGISLDRCLECSLAAAAGSIVDYEFYAVSANQHVVSRLLLLLARALTRIPLAARCTVVNFVEHRHCLWLLRH